MEWAILASFGQQAELVKAHIIALVRIEWEGQPADVREVGEGPALVLVHGFPLDGAMWSGVARQLASRFRVLKPDLPGRGNTLAPAGDTIESRAEFLSRILEQLPAPVGLAGFSMGGYVTLTLLARRPENLRAVALVDTRAGADDEAGRARRDEMIAKVRSEGVRAVADAMLEKLLAPDSLRRAELVERVRRIILRQPPETVAADLAAMRDRPDSTGLLPGIAMPALVLVGERDVLTPPEEAERMANAIPAARLVTVPQAGHLTPMEKPSAVAQALSEFFAPAPA